MEEITKNINKKTQNSANTNKKRRKTAQKLSKNTKYFEFYDDIKSSCHKIVDW